MSLENSFERIAVALEKIAAQYDVVAPPQPPVVTKLPEVEKPFKFDAEALSTAEALALVTIHGVQDYTEAHVADARDLVNGDGHSNNHVFVEELVKLLDVTPVKKMNNAAKMVIGHRVLAFWSIDDKPAFVQKLAKTKAAERATTEPDAPLDDLAGEEDIPTIDFVALRAAVREQVLALTKTNRDDVVAALKAFSAAGLKDVKDEDLTAFKGLLEEIK